MKKVLVVDDVKGWLNFHKTNIEYTGIADILIDCAESALSALDKIELSIDEPYDVIITDMQMESNFLPKLAGEWLIEQIQTFKQYSNTRIVIVSDSPSIALIAKKYNVEYVSKHVIRNLDSKIYAQIISGASFSI